MTIPFTIRFYFKTLTRVLSSPRLFFSQLPSDMGWKKPASFLLVSCLVFTGASLTSRNYQGTWVTGTILLINAMGMVLLSSALGYMVMVLSLGKKVTFSRFFSIYAYSSGVTLLSAWVPFFLFISEPWRWCLIGIGLTKNCGFRWYQSLWVIIVSIGIIVVFIESLLLITL